MEANLEKNYCIKGVFNYTETVKSTISSDTNTTSENSHALINKAKAGCQLSFKSIYSTNMSVCSFFGYKYSKFLSADEIKSCYNMAIWMAVNDFNCEKNTKFRTYLSHVMKCEVFKEISKSGQVYMPSKIRSMAYKVGMRLFYEDINSPTDMDISDAMDHFNYKGSFFNSIKEALDIVIFDVHGKKNNDLVDILEYFSPHAEQHTENELHLEHTNEALKRLVNEVITVYYHSSERRSIEAILYQFMHSNESKESIFESLGWKPSHGFSISKQLFTVIKQYLNSKNLSIDDFI